LSREIRERLDHPIVDADAHWIEPVPVFLDFLRDEAGSAVVDTFHAVYERTDRAWYAASPTERQTRRLKRRAWWSDPWRTFDRATASLPKLMYERLPELGIDFAVVFPTLGLTTIHYPDRDLRRAACRAMNRMTAAVFSGLRDRLEPVACIPIVHPDEAVDELHFAVRELGYKAILFGGSAVRDPVEGGGRPYVDTFGLDGAYNYDPFWKACAELGVAVCDHTGSSTWPDRQSPTNFVFNHVGHFAEGLHASCRSLLLGGVTRRFPGLPFAFLEGGVGWAAMLLLNLQEHWEKREVAAVRRYLDPRNLDIGNFGSLWNRYANGPLIGDVHERSGPMTPVSPFVPPQELSDREVDDIDDFAASGITSKDDIRAVFENRFFFGAEADDKLTWMAFRPELNVSLRPMFSSDIGHYDVLNMSHVVGEAWGLVETGLLDEQQFKQFTFSNVVDLHTGLRPDFFDGTVVEGAVTNHLARTGRPRP
jgi:hypothetical protein